MFQALWLSLASQLAVSQSNIIVHPGINIEVIYELKEPAVGGIGTPVSMDVDPITQQLYIAQFTPGGGDILVIDPAESRHVRTIPFFSQGLAFSPDGTLYFGVSTLLLAVWQREADIFRVFSSIPNVTDVQVLDSGELFVAASSFGPESIYPNTVMKVDRNDGFFEPVFSSKAARDANVASGYDLLSSFKITPDGTFYVAHHLGDTVRFDGESYTDINRRLSSVGGINETELTTSGNLVIQYDTASGHIFALNEQGQTQIIAYGDGLKTATSSNSGLTATESQLYAANADGKILKITVPEGETLASVLNADLGASSITGSITDLFSGESIAGASIRLSSGATTITDANGAYTFTNVKNALYEINVSLDGQDYRSTLKSIDLTAGADMVLDLSLNPGLPEFLAPGLGAEILATRLQDDIDISVDITLDQEGNIYSDNLLGGSITKILRDSVTREVVDSYIFSEGHFDNWFVAVDENLEVYVSNSNSSVLRLPTRANNETTQLTIDENDLTIVRDQDGIDRSFSIVTDVDGAAFLSNGDLILSSGSGGSIVPGLPEGTFDTLVRVSTAGNQSIFSRGGGLFENPDVIKADAQDRVLVANRNGNVVRVDQSGLAELIWPGNGQGKSEGLGAYTTSNDDGIGHLFLRGGLGDASDKVFRLLSSDGESLLTVAAGLSLDFGGFEFEDEGRSAIISDGNVVLRIYSLDERSIAEVVLENSAEVEAAMALRASKRKGEGVSSFFVNSIARNEPQFDYENATVDWELLREKEVPPATEPVQVSVEKSSGGGGSMNFLFFVILFASMKVRAAVDRIYGIWRSFTALRSGYLENTRYKFYISVFSTMRCCGGIDSRTTVLPRVAGYPGLRKHRRARGFYGNFGAAPGESSP